MANSVHRYRGNVSMAWIPQQLMTKELSHEKMWAQHIKQFIALTAGIETKSQEEMDKGTRESHILQEFSRWIEIINEKFPRAAVLPWLSFTTGTRSTRINGKWLYRNFQEGLRIFHRDFNTVWEAVLKEGISGKSKEEIWCRFCYLLFCKNKDEDPDNVTPEDFLWKRVEQRKWVFAFKYMGPCCELLELGECECHEFLANPKQLSTRNTTSEKRKAKGTYYGIHHSRSTIHHSHKQQVWGGPPSVKQKRAGHSKPWLTPTRQNVQIRRYLSDARKLFRTSCRSRPRRGTTDSNSCSNCFRYVTHNTTHNTTQHTTQHYRTHTPGGS